MHTASQLSQSMFAPTVDGRPGSYLDVFPGWEKRDRLGVLVDSPIGGIGAAMLIQLAVTAHFAADPARIGSAYPEVYMFHVGEFHGSLAQFDSFPPRKEVAVPDEPAAILEAINDRGITRLAVVDGPVEKVRHHLQEPGQFENTVRSVFAYSPTGRVEHGDVEIVGTSPVVEENVSIIIDPDGTKDLQERLIARLLEMPSYRHDGSLVMPRGDGPSPEQRAEVGRRRWETVSIDGRTRETYRRVPVRDALGMLHRRAAS